MTETVTTAVAKRDTGPRAMIEQYRDDFATVLPSHIKAATWVRVAQGALKRGKKEGDEFILETAARNNPAVFLAALLDAARQGLEPGTEQFYLTPRKVKGRWEILGITGYQGHIELIYRAGAVSSVIAEVVREHDEYHYERGVDARPVHRFPPFAGQSTRGKLVGAYAYAVMKDGAISRVVEIGQDDVTRIKKSATGADSEYSPWQTNEAAMWLKSAVRQLQKWVPTSPEYIREQLRAVRDVQSEQPHPSAPPGRIVNEDTGEVIDGELVDEHGQTSSDYESMGSDAS